MKLLYLSCHQVLEYDEVKLFHELGIDVFSTGTYACPWFREGMIRPGIDGLTHYPDLERLASTIVSGGYSIPQGLIDWADTIMFMHMPEALEKNWERIKHKRVIFRSIGQCVPPQERLLKTMKDQGLEIVRYSPMERNITDFCGEDALIRFYKDPEEFTGYTGKNPTVINFSQSLMQRRDFCHYDEIVKMMKGFDGKVYGTQNENLGSLNGGEVSYEKMKELMRDSRVFIYTGTWPASYTLSLIEAMMTGIPIVAIGKETAQNGRFEHIDFYEVHQIIQNELSGFVSDDINELRARIEQLLSNEVLAESMGHYGRERAIELFGKETISQQWRALLCP